VGQDVLTAPSDPKLNNDDGIRIYMALSYPINDFGPVCDIFTGGDQLDGPIESIDNISNPNINVSNLSGIPLGPNGIQFQFASGTKDDDSDAAGNINMLPEGKIALNKLTLSDIINGLVNNPFGGAAPGFGPTCDLRDDDVVADDGLTDNLDEPNIVFQNIEDVPIPERADNRKTPGLCRTVRSYNFLRANDFAPICDLGGGDDGFEKICPDGASGLDTDRPNQLDTFYPADQNPQLPPFPLMADNSPQMVCFTNPAGATICHTPQPGFPDPDDINWPRLPKGNFGEPNVDENRLRTRDTRFSFSMFCNINEQFDSCGIYDYVLPTHADYLNLEVIGGGGGAGGTDAGNFSATMLSNNSGGSGDYLKLRVNVNPDQPNILTCYVGCGGKHGPDQHNTTRRARQTFGRGGMGGHPASGGFSGSGGAGGGATDVYLNRRLICSVGGGGGGGGGGCNAFPISRAGAPMGNWDQYTWNAANPLANSETFEKSRFPPILSCALQRVDSHPSWSPFVKAYGVWPSFDQEPFPGRIFEGRLNIEFPTAGTYTFKMAADNHMAVYISPWNTTSHSQFILNDGNDELFNGGSSGIPGWDPSASAGTHPTPPATIDNGLFTLVGHTTNFTANPPIQFTRQITTAGRYVLKVCFYNEIPTNGSSSWTSNPACIALQILKPDASELWSTRTFFGVDGQDMSNDGPGSGGGGGNGGRRGLHWIGAGIGGGGSCSNQDSTCQGGSGGKTWVTTHPSVTIESFKHSEQYYQDGWDRKKSDDRSHRAGWGGQGGGRPNVIDILFGGNNYRILNGYGRYQTVNIPGLGQGIWQDSFNGISFTTRFMFGTPVLDSLQANSIPNITRAEKAKPRIFQINLRMTPRKTGNTWATEIKLMSMPKHGKGAGWLPNDIVTARFPHAQSDGTAPYHDVEYGQWTRGQILVGSLFGSRSSPVLPGTFIQFDVKIVNIITPNPSLDGCSGCVGFEAGTRRIVID